jgi:preprotein translocase SecE subunit
MAKSIKDRLMERMPGTRTATDEGRSAAASVGFPQKVSSFLKEFKTEMKKVTWPGRKETLSVLFIVVFLGLVDFALGRIVQSVLSY